MDASPQLGRCAVCGSNEIDSDEVIERGPLLLAECRRCQHRWTGRAPARDATPPAASAPMQAAA